MYVIFSRNLNFSLSLSLMLLQLSCLLCFVSPFLFCFLFSFFRLCSFMSLNVILWTHTGGKYRSICYSRTLFKRHTNEKRHALSVFVLNKFFGIFSTEKQQSEFFKIAKGRDLFSVFRMKHPVSNENIWKLGTCWSYKDEEISIGRRYPQALRIWELKIVSELVRCSLKL